MLLTLGSSVFVSPFLHKKENIKNCIFGLQWHKEEYNPGAMHCHIGACTIVILFLLIRKEIGTFSWALKSMAGPGH